MRSICAIVIAGLMSLSALAASEQPAGKDGNESLGGKLLEGLTPSVENSGPSQQTETPLRNSDVKPVAPRAGQPEPAQPVASPMIPFVRVQQGMRNAQAMLAQPVADKNGDTLQLAGEAQKDVVSQLDKLIADLSKQCQCCCQGGQCNKPGENPSAKPKPGNKPGTAAGRGKAAARESSDRLDATTARPVDKGDVNDVVKELWGHLPERSREQMLQSFSDEFLPKYELEIEQYYRRLGEEREAASTAK